MLITDTNTRVGTLTVNADASIALGRFARGQQIDFGVSDCRAAPLYVGGGATKWGDNRIGRQDQLRIKGPQRLTFEADAEELQLLIESAA